MNENGDLQRVLSKFKVSEQDKRGILMALIVCVCVASN